MKKVPRTPQKLLGMEEKIAGVVVADYQMPDKSQEIKDFALSSERSEEEFPNTQQELLGRKKNSYRLTCNKLSKTIETPINMGVFVVLQIEQKGFSRDRAAARRRYDCSTTF